MNEGRSDGQGDSGRNPQAGSVSLFCQHVEKHVIQPVANDLEHRFRKFLVWGGWLESGYCFAYYPEWLHEAFVEIHDKAAERPVGTCAMMP